MKKSVDPIKAKAGEIFRHTHGENGKPLRHGPEIPDSRIVQPKGDRTCKAGEWVCLTHGMAFRNGISKDSHISNKKTPCVLAWHCLEHGEIEEP